MIRFGDAFAVVAQPIAKGVDAVLGTNVAGCQGCKERQQRWNDFSDVIYDHFWKKKQTTNGDNMADEQQQIEFIITISVVAPDPYDPAVIDIIGHVKKGGGSVLAVNPRPVLVPTPQSALTPPASPTGTALKSAIMSGGVAMPTNVPPK